VKDAGRPSLHAREGSKRNRLEHRHAGLRLHLRGNQNQLRHRDDEQENAGAAADV
jgi:hypothetical protein